MTTSEKEYRSLRLLERKVSLAGLFFGLFEDLEGSSLDLTLRWSNAGGVKKQDQSHVCSRLGDICNCM